MLKISFNSDQREQQPDGILPNTLSFVSNIMKDGGKTSIRLRTPKKLKKIKTPLTVTPYSNPQPFKIDGLVGYPILDNFQEHFFVLGFDPGQIR